MIRNLWVLFLVVALNASAQRYVAEQSSITFFSDATIEDIQAVNTKSAGMFDSQTSDLVFSVSIREFQFHKKLMQQHFNDKYMESDKYPKATFSGKLAGYNQSGTGTQSVQAKGKLLIHGVTNDVVISGTVESAEGKIIMKSKFIIKLEDYKIKIPQLMWQNIAEQVEVTVDFTYKPQ